jgi:hypothetical protein
LLLAGFQFGILQGAIINYSALTDGVQDSNGILCANDRSLLVSGKEQQHSNLAVHSGRSSHWRSGFQSIVRKLAPRKQGIRQ